MLEDQSGGPNLSKPSMQRRGALRTLAAIELHHFQSHLLRLDHECRRSRFGNVVSDASMRDYAGRVNCVNTLVLGCFIDGQMRGAAELRSLQATWCSMAEA